MSREKSTRSKTDWSKASIVTVGKDEPSVQELKDFWTLAHAVPRGEFTTVKLERKPGLDLIVHLSPDQLKQWNVYRNHHGVTDQEEFEDMLFRCVEERVTCVICHTTYYARHGNDINEIKCPGCQLTVDQAWKKKDPSIKKRGEPGLPEPVIVHMTH